MTQEMPEAAGKDGQTNPAVFSDTTAPPRTDDELRRYAAERLADHLTLGVDLASRCEHLSMQAKRDKVGPLNAAARLMLANARIAETLAMFANIEHRRRSIVEHLQPANAKFPHLNSGCCPGHHVYTAEESAEIHESLRKKFEALRKHTGTKQGVEENQTEAAAADD